MELDRLQLEIDSYFREPSKEGAWSSNSKEITSAWLKEGLRPRSITRDMRWGTKVPLSGYEDKFYQFIGKDNIIFHSVIFPGSQIGTQETGTKLHHHSSTEYLTYEGGKFSQSRGIETSDSELNWESFLSSNKNSLLKNLGNFVSRVEKFLNSKRFLDIVPNYTDYYHPSFVMFKEEISNLIAQYTKELDAVKLRAGLSTVMQVSSKGNNFLQSNGLDNKLAKTEPLKSGSMNAQLRNGPPPIPDHWEADSIKPGHEIGKAVEEAKKEREEELTKKSKKKASIKAGKASKDEAKA
ncbi:hypothetical protein MMC11_002805 [Xylographa trunciseda]|nr:hypothetical protein [Xylographa trunciseda]